MKRRKGDKRLMALIVNEITNYLMDNVPHRHHGRILHKLHGSGFLDRVWEFFSPRTNGYNNTSKKTLELAGNIPVISLYLMRTPINGMINKALNVVSMGSWDSLRAKYGYDKLFHLALIAEVIVDGVSRRVIIEKNESINISFNYVQAGNSELIPVPFNKTITINEMLNKARHEAGDRRFFLYDAFNRGEATNCQGFLLLLLQSSGLLTNRARDFLYQDMTDVLKSLPSYVPKVARAVTDIAGTANKLLGRGGAIDEATYLRRQSKGAYPKDLTYSEYVRREQEQRRAIDAEVQQLGEQNKAYEEYYQANPNTEEVATKFDENGDPVTEYTVVTRGESKRRNHLARMKKFNDNPMGKVVQGLTDVADMATNLPFVPKYIKEAYKHLAPPTSKYYDNNILKGNGLKKRKNKNKKVKS